MPTNPLTIDITLQESVLQKLTWKNPWLQLPEDFYQRVQPTPLDKPYFIHCNAQPAELLGLSAAQLQNDATLQFLNGSQLPSDIPAIASVYAGHQFGIYTAQLGDGRVLSLGEVLGNNAQRYEIQLKGAGLTPYSRTLDGRCPLGTVIREYLGSEALAGLGIPTTRSLCLLGSTTVIQRDRPVISALLVRMARSHIRFGHFEYFHHKGDFDKVKKLTEFVIENYFPELLNEPMHLQALRLLEAIVETTARLVADWQSVGFTHGVINTDNMTILGDTLDFGPFGFMETYNPEFLPNPSDDLGRYQFDQQPEIGRWNCLALAEALSSLLPAQTIPAKLLRLYRQQYQQHYLQQLRLKLGLFNDDADDTNLIEALLATLQTGHIDYTNFFRQLSYFCAQDNNPAIDNLSTDPDSLKHWLKLYQERISIESTTDQERQSQMRQVNPHFILRKCALEQAIENAEAGDFTEFYRLLKRLRNPFSE